MSSGCGDVLSLADLQTAKKHQLFEAEVITGKSGGVATGADIDYATNEVTGQTQKTLPAVLRDAGFRPASFTFGSGGTLAVGDSDMAVLWSKAEGGDGQYYFWKGALPKVIPAGSTPENAGGISDSAWMPMGDLTLRDELAANSGAALIGTTLGGNVQEKIEDVLSAQYREKNIKYLTAADYEMHRRGSLSVLFQGDSMTAGLDGTSTDTVPPSGEDWARHATVTYPARFTAFIKEQCGLNVTPVVRAISGYNVKQAYEQSSWQSNPNCNVAVIMYGLNDSGDSGNPAISIDDYINYMELMIRRFIDWGAGVVVCSCATGGFGAYGTNAQDYARRIKNLANLYGCAYFNANEVTYVREFAATQSDGIHFNSNGYAKLGESLASMFMGSGLLPYYRPISSELVAWPGITSDQIQYHDALNNISISRAPDAAYTVMGITGVLPAGNRAVMSFSFYHDAETSDIELVGSATANSNFGFAVSQHTTTTANLPYYEDSKKSPIRAYPVKEPSPVVSLKTSLQSTGIPKRLGTLVGRGWKTISFFNDNLSTDATYVQAITIRPLPLHLASSPGQGLVRYGTTQTVSYSVPPRDGYGAGGAGVPDVVNLANSLVVMRMPYDLCPMVRDPVVDFFDCGFATLKIKAMGGTQGNSYLEAILSKTQGGTYFDVMITKQVGTWPTIIAESVSLPKMITTEANTSGPGMPQEAIYDINYSDTTGSTIGNENGVYLRLFFNWGAETALMGYYNITVESSARGFGGANSNMFPNF